MVVSNIFYVHPYLGEDSHFDGYFWDGLVQPPTRWWVPRWWLQRSSKYVKNSPSEAGFRGFFGSMRFGGRKHLLPSNIHSFSKKKRCWTMKCLTSHISIHILFFLPQFFQICLTLVFSLMIHCQEIWFFSYGRDGHQPYSMGLYAHYKDSLLKVGWPSPI